MAKKSNYKFQLRGTLIVWSSIVSISNDLETDSVVEFTDEACLLYNVDKTIIERVRANASGGTLTLIKRGMEQDSETEQVSLEKERRDGSYGAMTIFAPQIVDQLSDNTFTGANEFTGDVTMSGSFRDPVYADATARDAAIPTPVNGMRIYNTALWLFQKYQAWVWTDDTGWGATPNASETVAGKVEIATDPQFTAWEEVWETGAILVAHPWQIKTKNDAQDSAIQANSDAIPNKATTVQVWNLENDSTYVTPFTLADNYFYSPIAWDTYQVWESNAEASTTSGSYVKLKEIEVDRTWWYRVNYENRESANWADAWRLVYVNWSPFSWINPWATTVWTARSEDITVTGWDLVQLFVKAEVTETAFVRNFSVDYDVSDKREDNIAWYFTGTVNL